MKCALCLLHPVHLLVAYNFSHDAAAAATAGFKYFFLFNEQPVSFLCFNRHLHRIFFYLISAVFFIFFLFFIVIVVFSCLTFAEFLDDFCVIKRQHRKTVVHVWRGPYAMIPYARFWAAIRNTKNLKMHSRNGEQSTNTLSHAAEDKKVYELQCKKKIERNIRQRPETQHSIYLSCIFFYSCCCCFFFCLFFFILFPFHPFPHTLRV